jgi:S-adenosylmethionine:tRNA ribosyltransferase-isomerase
MCFVGNNKKWKSGKLSREIIDGDKKINLTVSREEACGNAWIVLFEWDDDSYSFAHIIEMAGTIPLPPYLNRAAEADDKERYQTVYAQHEGSVAAPTAGLHFTPNVFAKLKNIGIDTEFVTLHVGAGTFKPVDSETIGEHEMHVERIQITRENVENLLKYIHQPIIAVGTTSVRTLESLYWIGVKLCYGLVSNDLSVEQWEPYELSEKPRIGAEESLSKVLAFMDDNDLDVLYGSTKLMIAPGYEYRIVKGIVTNFHQPQSTLLLLVSALIGEVWKQGYSYALNNGFRFLSYGDSCLFLP